MRKKMLKILSVILAVTMLFSVVSASAATSGNADMTVKTECGGNCGNCPTIIVPGILQSQVYLQNEDGTDMLASDGMPIMEAMDMRYFVDAEQFSNRIMDVILPAVLMLLTGSDMGLTDKLTEIFDELLGVHYFNEDGTRKTPISVQECLYSLEEADRYDDKFSVYTGKDRTQKGAAIKEVDVSEVGELIGYDHLYYFFYESFGNLYDIAERFNSFVEMVKAQTGHDKVNVVFISLGGAVGTAYLDLYYDEENGIDEISDDLNRVLFVAAAVDGTTVMSDVFAGNFTLTDYDLLYSGFLPSLLGMFMDPEFEWLGYLLNIVLRFIPQNRIECLENALAATIQNTLIAKLMARCSTMWGLIPSSEYPALAEKYLTGIECKPLREDTDKYYQAQLDNPEQIKSIVENTDIDVFNICGYGLDIPAILDSYYTETSDNIINTSSTSMGAECAAPGTTLGDNYVPAIDASYISPDGMIDAGAGYLPDHTWYVKGQSHLELQSSKDVIHQCVQVVLDESITDARVNNGGYPQFNNFRDSKGLNGAIHNAGGQDGYNEEKLNAANPGAEQREEFIAAYNNAVSVYKKTVWDAAECDAARDRLNNIMAEIGMTEGSDKSEFEMKALDVITYLLSGASKALSSTMGSKSFWNLF